MKSAILRILAVAAAMCLLASAAADPKPTPTATPAPPNVDCSNSQEEQLACEWARSIYPSLAGLVYCCDGEYKVCTNDARGGLQPQAAEVIMNCVTLHEFMHVADFPHLMAPCGSGVSIPPYAGETEEERRYNEALSHCNIYPEEIECLEWARDAACPPPPDTCLGRCGGNPDCILNVQLEIDRVTEKLNDACAFAASSPFASPSPTPTPTASPTPDPKDDP